MLLKSAGFYFGGQHQGPPSGRLFLAVACPFLMTFPPTTPDAWPGARLRDTRAQQGVSPVPERSRRGRQETRRSPAASFPPAPVGQSSPRGCECPSRQVVRTRAQGRRLGQALWVWTAEWPGPVSGDPDKHSHLDVASNSLREGLPA